MPSTEIVDSLKALSSKEPWRDGLHRGISGDILSIELEYGEKLMWMVVDNQRKTIVEIGTGSGYSTTWMMLGLEEIGDGCIFTIDKKARQPYIWDLVGLKPDRQFLFIGALEDKFSMLPKGIDMVFLDSDHQINKIVDDVEMLVPKLADDAIVCVHDVNYCREMGDRLEDYFNGFNTKRLRDCGVKSASKERWRYREITNSCGLGVATRIRERGKI